LNRLHGWVLSFHGIAHLPRRRLSVTHQAGLSVTYDTGPHKAQSASAGFYQSRNVGIKRRKRAQPPRSRRDCFGELIQVDGRDHE
jgi:hypothetical protein